MKIETLVNSHTIRLELTPERAQSHVIALDAAQTLELLETLEEALHMHASAALREADRAQEHAKRLRQIALEHIDPDND